MLTDMIGSFLWMFIKNYCLNLRLRFSEMLTPLAEKVNGYLLLFFATNLDPFILNVDNKFESQILLINTFLFRHLLFLYHISYLHLQHHR